MASEAKTGSGWVTIITYAFLILMVVFVFFGTLISNLISFDIVTTHGIGQFFKNNLHFHRDIICKTKQPFKVYDRPLAINQLQSSKAKVFLKKGSRFKLKGYNALEHTTWVAIKAFKSNQVVYGYIMLPKKISVATFSSGLRSCTSCIDGEGILGSEVNNQYFSEVPLDDEDNFRQYLYKKFKASAFKTANIKSVSGGTKIQEIEESKDYKIVSYLESKPETSYYCSSKDFNLLKSLYEQYLGDNFETYYLQTIVKYDSQADGVYKRPTLLKVLESMYFKIFVVVFLFWLLRRLFRRRRSPFDQEAA